MKKFIITSIKGYDNLGRYVTFSSYDSIIIPSGETATIICIDINSSGDYLLRISVPSTDMTGFVNPSECHLA